MCPDTLREGSLVDDLRVEMHWPKLFFLWLSINYTSNFPIIFSLSNAATPPRAILVKSDDSVYNVNVDV